MHSTDLYSNSSYNLLSTVFCLVNYECAITAQSHLGNNKTLAQLKACIVMTIHNMVKVVVLNMLMVNFPKYFNNCTECAFQKFALIALFLLIAHFITFFVASLGARNVTEDL